MNNHDGTTRRRGKYMRVGLSPVKATSEQRYKQRPEKRSFHPGRVWGIIPVVLGVVWLVIAFFPILYMFMTSLRPQVDFFTDIPWLPPSHPTLTNYQNVLQNNFVLYFANTAFVTIISVLLIAAVSLFVAYAISKIRNRFTRVVFSLFLFGLAIPLQATIIPIYAM